MGVCCSSAAAPDHNPYQQQAPPRHAGNNSDPAASTQPINTSQPQLHARPSTTASNQSNVQHHGHGHSRGLTDRTNRPNKPLRLPKTWTSKDKIWTRNDLDSERRAFFDTRVTNESAIWNAINQACEVLWGGGDAGEDDAGLGTAQLILDAAEITLPTGDLVGGCYDRFGNHYRVPEHVVSDPTNLSVQPPDDPDMAVVIDGDAAVGEDSNEPPETEEETEIRRQSKGKAVEIVIEVKRSDLSEKKHKITINKLDSCRIVARKVENQTQLSPNKTVRLYYRGKKLKESLNLMANGWKTGDIISAMVFDRDRTQWGI